MKQLHACEVICHDGNLRKPQPIQVYYWSPTGTAGVVDYVVPLCQELRKTVYVRKVRSDDHKDASSCAVTSSRSSADCHQLQPRRRDHVTRQFARFRQLVKYIPAEQIVDVSSNTLFTSVYSGHLFAGESPTELNFPPNGCQIVCLKSFFSAGTVNRKCIMETFLL